MKRILVPCLVLMLAPVVSVAAQPLPAPPAPPEPARAPQPPQPPAPGDDPIAQHLFPPDVVMRHGSAIGLDEKQRAAIKDVVQKAQSKFLDVQWDMQEEQERIVRLLQARPIDEAAVLGQVDKVLSLEREVKKTQLSLLIRIKNLLTDSQQARLAELRNKTD